MKKSVDILGLPVISLSEGTEYGKVKDLVINPATGTVAALIVDDGKWYLGAKLLPFAAIIGIGEYAVTIEKNSDIVSLAANTELEQFLISDVKVIGSSVLTRSGQIQGKVTEIVIDDAGHITSCEVEEANGSMKHIAAEQVRTYGRAVLVVAAAAEAEAVREVQPASPAKPVESTTISSAEAQPASVAAATATAATPPAQAANEDDSAKRFDDKSRKYLLGKKASRRIETDNGLLIVDQGGEITEEVLQKAKLAGKFVELSMSIQ